MKRMIGWLCVVACLLLIAGCGEGPKVRKELTEPLTVEKWKALPKDVKYRGDTLEHLRRIDPKYQDEQVWQKFLKRVVLPERKKDFRKS